MLFLKDNFTPRQTIFSILHEKTPTPSVDECGNSFISHEHNLNQDTDKESIIVNDTINLEMTKGKSKRNNHEEILTLEKKKIKLFEERLKLILETK